MKNISFKNISKTYNNNFTAVKDISFEISRGEFAVLVGPSGCGKSTILKMLAGLEDITQGELYFDDKLMNSVESKNRNIGMVFQNYALYPHLSVFDNLAFPLKINKVDKKEIKSRVEEIANMLGLFDYLQKKPKHLSGGQRQRVALGRAIIKQPNIFLFDEPLSNLDAKLRVQMRTEIINLHRKYKATSIYVTHDQTEAMTMADRIILLNEGKVVQIGSPNELYNSPQNIFAASFLGTPQINLFPGHLDGGKFIFDSGESIEISNYNNKDSKDYLGKAVLGIRPEDITFATPDNYRVKSSIINIEFMGFENIIYFDFAGLKSVRTNTEDASSFEIGQTLYLNFNDEKIHIFKENGERI